MNHHRSTRSVRLLLSLAGMSLLAVQARGDPPAPYPGLRKGVFEYLVREAGAVSPIDTVRTLSTLNSVRASADYHRAAAFVAEQARTARLEDVRVESFPADGRIWYGGFRSEPGWNVRSARLWTRLESPDASSDSDLPLVDYARVPLGLVWFSRSANLTADVVSVGEGTRKEDYAGKDVRGRIVLATGPFRIVHRLAVYEYGAAGALSSWSLFPDEFLDAHSSDGAGIRPWEAEDGRPAGFVFAISPRQGRELAAALGRGPVRARVAIDVEMGPSAYEVVSARVPGGPTDRELVLVSHLDSTAPGACHNAAPAALLLDVGRTLTTMREAGLGREPLAGVRLLWVPEHRGTMAYLLSHRDLARRAVAAINLDLLADRQDLSGAVLQLRQTPASRPSYINDVVASLLESVARDNVDDFDLYPSRFRFPLTAPSGSSGPWRILIAPFQGASDHVEWNAAGVPALSLGSWRYPQLGTTGDRIEMFDPTHFRRLAFVVAASAYDVSMATPAERREVSEVVLARARARLAAALAQTRISRARGPQGSDASIRSGLTAAIAREVETVRSSWWWKPAEATASVAAIARTGRDALADLGIGPTANSLGPATIATRPPAAARLVPSLADDWLGPVTIDFLDHTLGPRASDHRSGLDFARQHGDVAFEAANFVDGRRSIAKIAGLLDEEFGAQDRDPIVSYFRALEACGIVRLSTAVRAR